MRLAIASALVFCIAATTVLAHSWVDCVKYDPINQVCLGYARGYPGRDNALTNNIYTYLFDGSPKSQAMCSTTQQQVMNYTDRFPMATAQPGETIFTTWEVNGHLDNANPTEVKILYYPASNNEFQDVSEKDTAMVAGTMSFGTSNNCYTPESPNTACFGSWKIPEDLVPGQVYHFVWFWYFNANPAGQWYSTCFDVNVQSASHVVRGGDNASLLSVGEPNLSYILGFTDEIRKQVADVTTIGSNNQVVVAPIAPIGHNAGAATTSSVESYSSSLSSLSSSSSSLAFVPMPTFYSSAPEVMTPPVESTSTVSTTSFAETTTTIVDTSYIQFPVNEPTYLAPAVPIGSFTVTPTSTATTSEYVSQTPAHKCRIRPMY
ncbi:hypothetical protein LPJ66_001343 [Kickxella alabastrina]|uniref:Uncharacterized protein n=1 Tax=Kickxella alabastrina TaxID=61397 RepID=A0ACC1ITT9_9FUNG|nr:hypothetical protein LPJ66_001343 [Kickxella alabastrina]